VLGHFIWTKFELQASRGRAGTHDLVQHEGRRSLHRRQRGRKPTRTWSRGTFPRLEAMLRGATLSNAYPACRFFCSRFFLSWFLRPRPQAVVVTAGPQAGLRWPGSLDDYVFSTPPRWTAMKDATAIALQAPGAATGERCVIQLWPMRSAGANLFVDANSAFMEAFKTTRCET